MSEESGDTTAEELRAAAAKYDNAVESGGTPSVVIDPLEEDEYPELDEAEPEKAEAEDSPSEPDEDKPESFGDKVLDESDSANEQVKELTEGETQEEPDEPSSKWAKNEKRKANSWQKLNSDKEAVKREREELEQIRKDLRDKEEKLNEGKPVRDDAGRTAEDYDSAAETAELDGDYDEAKSLKESADKLRKEAEQKAKDTKVREFQEGFERTRNELMDKIPELKDPDSYLTKAANDILKENSDLVYLPDGKGLRHAVQIAQWKLGSESAEKSKSEIKELTDKLTKLEKKTSVNGGFTNEKLDGGRPFNDLSDDEQMEYLRREAQEADDTL